MRSILKTTAQNFISFILANWFQLLILTVLTTIAYQHIFHYEFVIDDNGSVDARKTWSDLIPFFKSPAESTRSLMYLIMYNVGNGKPFVFHIASFLGHIGNIWIVYILIKKMINKEIAFINALFFSIHPIFVESVTWISAGPYVHYAFFMLLSLYFYMLASGYHNPKKKHQAPFNKKFLLASFIAYVFATLMSHKALAYPLILAAYELAFGNFRKNWKILVPFAVFTASWGFYYIPFAHQRVVDNATEYHLKVGYDNPLIQIPVAVTSYIQLIFWPDKLSLYHSELRYSVSEMTVRGLGLIGFFALIIWCYKKNRMVFFWLTFFFLTLLTTLLPMRLSWVYAERYAYPGALGIFTIVSIYIYKFLKQYRSYRTLGGLLLILIISGLIIRTYVRNLDWRTEDDLWLATAKTAPSDFKTHNNVGTVYMKRGDLVRAEQEFILAIRMNKHYADAYYNLGLLYMNANIFDQAEKFYLEAIKNKPTFWQPHNGLTIVYIANKNFVKGEEYAKKTIQLNPNFPGGYNNLGLVYQVTNRRTEAIASFKKALTVDEKLWQTHMNLVLLYHLDKQQAKRDEHIKLAIKHQPQPEATEFYTRLGQIYLTIGKSNEAKQAFSKALSINPVDKQAQEAMTTLMESQK